MKRTAVLLLLLLLLLGCAPAEEALEYPAEVTFVSFLCDLVTAAEEGTGPGRIDIDDLELGDEIVHAVAEHWKRVYLDPAFRLRLHGTDDPSALSLPDAHAIVVLGCRLQDGGMTKELKQRCKAAAALAEAFPSAVLVLTGGATGDNNPKGNTEAGRMRNYLVNTCGIDENRIRTDRKAKNTRENAFNTLAILEEMDIHGMTLVTSSYHQRWAQVIFNAAAAMYRAEHGFEAVLIGDFSCEWKPPAAAYYWDHRIAVKQLGELFGLSEKDMARLPVIPQYKP